MSCHDIGRGMEAVAHLVYQMYKNNELSLEAARKIILRAKNAVHYCDGNEGEAVAFLEDNSICTVCFETKDTIYDIFNCYDDIRDKYKKDITRHSDFVWYTLCSDCYIRLLRDTVGEEAFPQALKDFPPEER